MSSETKVYDYKMLYKPGEDTLNRFGAEGYAIVGVATDGRDGEIRVVIMQREATAVVVTETREHETPQRNGRRAR